jgi:hypothetical protein
MEKVPTCDADDRPYGQEVQAPVRWPGPAECVRETGKERYDPEQKPIVERSTLTGRGQLAYQVRTDRDSGHPNGAA